MAQNETTSRYNKLRHDLVKGYEVITKKTFLVMCKRSIFLTTEQLERIERDPPLGYYDLLNTVEEYPITISKMVKAQEIMGDELHLGFRYPSRDIPIIYETIQEYIRNWTEIMANAYGYKTATIYELSLLENIAKGLFYSYKHYKIAERKRDMDDITPKYGSDFSMVDLYMNVMKHGREDPEDISFYSYLDSYRSRIKEYDGHFSLQTFSNSGNISTIKNHFSIPKLHTGL